jgi:hypothetical protein
MHFSLSNSFYPEPYCYSVYYILGRASNVFNNAINGMILKGEKKEVTGETRIPLPLCPPQITHELTADR